MSQITIDVPDDNCSRCGAISPARSQQLRRVDAKAPGAITDSGGGGWRAGGAQLVEGWTSHAVDGTQRLLCASCSTMLHAEIEKFVATPPVEPAPAGPTSSAAARASTWPTSSIPRSTAAAPIVSGIASPPQRHKPAN